MSAILGRIELDGRPVDGARFLERLDTVAVYGPDLGEHWIEGPVAVGRRLLRLSPAHRHERLEGPINGWIVVADAVLDNRRELADELNIPTVNLPTISETELVRRAFIRWGPSCADRLCGDFAFAAIQPETREVFLVADHIGSRPLFWALREHTLIFSTDVEAIVGFGDRSWSIDDRVVAEHLFYPLHPVSKPFFKHIQAIPAGGFVAVREASATTATWWRPSTKPTRTRKPADAVAECRMHLERAIADRIAVEGPIGAHLSGGIDSTGVSVIAARQLAARGRRLKRAYAWSPPVSDQYSSNQRKDERERISQVASTENIDVVFGDPDSLDWLALLDKPIALKGEVDLADEIPVLRAAHQDGVRLMLTGWGGDEAFSAHGRGYLAYLVLTGRVGRARQFAHNFTGSLRNLNVLSSLAWREILYLLLPNLLHRRFSPYRNRFPRASYISGDLARRHHYLHGLRGIPIKFGIDPNANLAKHVSGGFITMRMGSWAAWSAPYGFQYRYPLTDRRLLEFLFTLDPGHLYMGERTRGLAQMVLADCLPKGASKNDIANERLRGVAREAAWRRLASRVVAGNFSDDCPWLDCDAFRQSALNPRPQDSPVSALAFCELLAAARIWALYRMAVQNNWI